MDAGTEPDTSDKAQAMFLSTAAHDGADAAVVGLLVIEGSRSKYCLTILGVPELISVAGESSPVNGL